MLVGGHSVDQPAGDPGLADPGLAAQQHDLALAVPGPPPPFQQQRELVVAADNGTQDPALARLEAAFDRPLGEHHEGRDRASDALQRLTAQVLELEQITQQPPRRLAHHHLPGCGDALQPGRQVGRLADHRLLLRRPFADQITDDDETGGDADPNAERRVARRPHRRQRLNDGEPGANRPLRIVLVRARKTEIGEDAVAHILGHMPLEPRDLARRAVLKTAQDPTHLLRIEPLRQSRRANQIHEHQRQLPPLGGRRRR